MRIDITTWDAVVLVAIGATYVWAVPFIAKRMGLAVAVAAVAYGWTCGAAFYFALLATSQA